MRSGELSRRRLMSSTVAGAAAVAAAPLLAGCGGSSNDKNNTSEKNSKVVLPNYAAYQGGIRPDMPGDGAGLQQAFLRYPANPVSVVKEKPGNGGKISAFLALSSTLPPSEGKNKFWQALNDATGTELDIQMATFSDYPDKLATLTAGNDLPDVVQFRGAQPQLPALLAKRFTDLSEFVAKDAINDYPFLANLSTDAWRSAVFNAGIYGVPIEREATGSMIYRRDDIFAARGIDPDPKSFADFKKICKEFTNPRKGKWATAIPAGVLNFISEMLGAPNNWKEENGKFTRGIETEQARQAMADTISLIKAGYLHPDSFVKTAHPTDFFAAGVIPMIYDSYSAWPGYVKTDAPLNKNFDLGAMLPPSYDTNSQAVIWRGPPNFSFTAITKTDKTKVKQILKVLNWFAAPFGSSEYLLRKYGVKGVDYTLNGTDPVLTETGSAETTLPVLYLCDAPWPIYQPGYPDAAKKNYEYAKKAIPMSIKDPTIGLFSNTAVSDSSEAEKALQDVQLAVMQSQKPMSAWDDAVKTWKKQVGDKIRSEYEKSFAETH